MRNILFIALAALFFYTCFLLLIPSQKQTSKSSLGNSKAENEVSEGFPSANNAGNISSGINPLGKSQSFAEQALKAFATPITFYGRVLDQHGVPIAGATVLGSAGTSMSGKTTKLTTISDTTGNFGLSTRGMSLFVSVNKPGFYHIFPNQISGMVSEKGFDYAADLGDGIHKPDPSSPINFHLFKPGLIEPLIRLRDTSIRLNRSGEAVEVSLDPGHGEKHRLSISCKMDNDRTADGRYSWKYEIKAIDGGLQLSGDIFQFQAPAIGYKISDVIDMSALLPQSEWKDFSRQSYFVRFNDNTFARIKTEMIAGGDYFAVIEGYYNPKPGSRNLEADPSQR